jgi:hypothetical protein
MKFSEVCAAIASGDFDSDLRDLGTAITDRRDIVAKNRRNKMKKGTAVRLVNTSDLDGEEGVIIRIRRSRADVSVGERLITAHLVCLEPIN